MRIVVVCNPISGGGRARAGATRLAELLVAEGHAVDVRWTVRAGDGRAIAAALDGAVERLVVVGGDGTLNEALNGLADPARIPLALLPVGTANLLGRELGLPRDAAAAARLVGRGAIRRLDMGLAGTRRFLSVASAGFDAAVVAEVARRRRGRMSYARWLPAIVAVARGYHPPALAVEIDGAAAIPGQLVIVSNVRRYGGLFVVSDRARCDSGHLDVCVLRSATLPALARAAVAGLTRGIAALAGAVHATGTRVAVRAPAAVAVEVDGDPAGTTPLDIRLHAGRVSFVVGPG